MQEFQDEAAFFFMQHTNPVVGYVITTPAKLEPLKAAFTTVRSAACVVVRDERDFDMFAEMWQFPYIENLESLDLTECLTMVHFTRSASEASPDSAGYRNVYIPDRFLRRVVGDAADAGHMVVVLCSLTRALLLALPFDDSDIDCLQAAAMGSSNWRPYRVYDEETMDEAARMYGHLHKGQSEGWGVEVVSFSSEDQARAFREEHSDPA